jgi:hypothetical protein
MGRGDMLSREDYRTSWEKKLAGYRANGIDPVIEAKAMFSLSR